MSVASSVPEGASPPPEPPPRDYSDMTVDFRDVDDKVNVDEKLVIDGDVKIRARLEACRQGMIQLEALRTKHIKLMQTLRIDHLKYIDIEFSSSEIPMEMIFQEMRGRLPTIPGCADVQARIKRTAAISDRSSLQSVDSGVSSLGQRWSVKQEEKIPSHRCSSIFDLRFRQLAVGSLKAVHDFPILLTGEFNGAVSLSQSGFVCGMR
ncbi:unnamed protein product [Angiostrongylus costaricensis]|uniref:Reverse transcriptase domain-containing protein n=1 Tax=Angiostrongylus costaricensis TaxID=334426 RepID=A0A0R3PAN3_ANGCS|nr:unnamed protein product [Angiostrongylus costaricensis]